MKQLLRNIRFYILCFSFLLSIGFYFFITTSFSETIQVIRLTQTYALTALTFLYSALLAGPLCYTFKFLPYRAQYLKARRALGVSTFYFALLHASFAFFGQLGGFAGLGFLSSRYLIAISLSFTALVILSLLAATSFDAAVKKMQFKNWKLLHRLVYVAGIFILIHAAMLGTHFQDLTALLPQFVISALAFLLFLELLRIDAFLKKKFSTVPQISFASIPLFAVFLAAFLYLLLPKEQANQPSLGIHSQHLQIAKDLQSKRGGSNVLVSLKGDPTKRFTVSFDYPETVKPGEDVPLSFVVYDANTGSRQYLFQKFMDKYMHLIIVDSSLEYFNHIHPNADGGGFSITTQFPKAGIYHLYTDFQPHEAIEQQFGFTLPVGNSVAKLPTIVPENFASEKTFGKYKVAMSYEKPLKASSFNKGEQQLKFTITDAKTGNPIKTLKPYLGAFGHLVMIRKDTYEYLHVHPVIAAPSPDANGGPEVAFLPLGLWGEVKPGTYRVFAQFNPNNELITTDFTVVIE